MTSPRGQAAHIPSFPGKTVKTDSYRSTKRTLEFDIG